VAGKVEFRVYKESGIRKLPRQALDSRTEGVDVVARLMRRLHEGEGKEPSHH
jgi:hypothetical protein